MTYDRCCYDLAERFVDDSEIISSLSTPARDSAISKIAAAVQTVVEQEIEEIENDIQQQHADAIGPGGPHWGEESLAASVKKWGF